MGVRHGSTGGLRVKKVTLELDIRDARALFPALVIAIESVRGNDPAVDTSLLALRDQLWTRMWEPKDA